MERKAISPESVIEDLYNNQISALMDELHKTISLKQYEYDERWAYIIVKVCNLDYNPVVLNEVKRRYVLEGWGNIFYKVLDTNQISFQLYFPQIKTGV